MRWIRNIAISLIVTLVLFEFGSFVATKLNLFVVNDTPELYTNFERNVFDGRTENSPWGAWHVPNISVIQTEPCFEADFSFNEIGARDSSFSALKGKSIFLLGDSFAEGFGINMEDTSQYYIEQKLGVNVLNFGTSGNFGPLQELMIYEQFKDIYDHDAILVYFLPANDFTDNDMDYWAKLSKTRYRPYFGKDDNVLTPTYFPDSKPQDTISQERGSGFRESIKRFIYGNFWSGNFIRTVLILMRPDTEFGVSRHSAGYYDPSDLEQKDVLAAFERIVTVADGRPVVFLSIPAAYDIIRFNDGEIYKDRLWYKSLVDLSSKYDNAFFIDLMDYVPQDYEKLFFTCDSHWSVYGNQWVGDIIVKFLQQKHVLQGSG